MQTECKRNHESACAKTKTLPRISEEDGDAHARELSQTRARLAHFLRPAHYPVKASQQVGWICDKWQRLADGTRDGSGADYTVPSPLLFDPMPGSERNSASLRGQPRLQIGLGTHRFGNEERK